MILERFLEQADFQKALDERGRNLHSWTAVSEQYEGRDSRGAPHTWFVTVFYALFHRTNQL